MSDRESHLRTEEERANRALWRADPAFARSLGIEEPPQGIAHLIQVAQMDASQISVGHVAITNVPDHFGIALARRHAALYNARHR